MVVVCENEQQEDFWRSELLKAEAEVEFKDPKKQESTQFNLPLNRVKVITNAKAVATIFNSGVEANEKLCTAYETWLRAWKMPSTVNFEGWRLCVGLQRPADQVELAWGKQLKGFRSDLVDLDIRSAELIGKSLQSKAIESCSAKTLDIASDYETPVSYTHLTLPTIYSV